MQYESEDKSKHVSPLLKDDKPSQIARKAKDAVKDVTQQPAWTQAMGNHSPTSLQAEMPASLQHDLREQEADRMAEMVSTSNSQEVPEKNGTALTSLSASHATVLENVQGQFLDGNTRSFMEGQFGHDFGQVKVHVDTKAAESAEALNAQAYTLGKNIVFGQNKYAPQTQEGKQLLAHELAHVVQQSHQSQGLLLQRKLKLTGTSGNIARALAILNGGLFGYTVSVSSTGSVSIARNNIQGPPTLGQDTLRSRLENIINNSHDVLISISSGSRTIVGSYATGDIDIQDMEAFGSGAGANSVATLIHELEEQFQKQVNSMRYGGETSGAHAEGIKAESEVIGATRGPQRVVSSSSNSDGTSNAVLEFPWTYPDGKVVTIVMTIDHNNVTRVVRR